MGTYKVNCEFFVEAKNKEEVIDGLSWETDFFNNHIIIENADLPKNEELWADYTKE